MSDNDKEFEEFKKIAEMEARLSCYDGDDKIVSSREKKVELDNLPPERRLDIDMKELNAVLDGFRTEEITVISGDTGQGKTTFARTLTSQFAKKGYKPLWFCYEGGMRNFFRKFVNLPVFYLPNELMNGKFDWIEERIIEAKLKYDIDIVFIDHLHYVLEWEIIAKGNGSAYIGHVMQELVALAKKHNISIFLIAHVKNIIQGRDPNLGDIRDSSFVKQEASNVIMIWRRIEYDKETGEIKFYNNEGKIGIFKNRREGVLATIKVELGTDKMFYEQSDTSIVEDIVNDEQRKNWQDHN